MARARHADENLAGVQRQTPAKFCSMAAPSRFAVCKEALAHASRSSIRSYLAGQSRRPAEHLLGREKLRAGLIDTAHLRRAGAAISRPSAACRSRDL